MSTVNGFQVGSETLKYNYESLENYNTPEFSSVSTYSVGDYVIYQGKLYKCTTAVTTAGSWSSSNWTLAVLSDDVSDLSNTIDELEDAVNDQVTGLDTKAPVVINTALGDIASFSDGADGMPIKHLVANIKAVQSGTGDPSPDNIRSITGWTGLAGKRAGKNLLKKIAPATNTTNGVTFTVDSEGIITANGTNTGTTSYRAIPLNSSNIKPGNYYFYSGLTDGVNGTKDAFIWDNTTNSRAKQWDGITNTDSAVSNQLYQVQILDGHEYVYDCRIANGITVTDCKFYLMICPADTTEATWEPYISEDISVNWQSQVGTVYGGTVDVVTGKLIVTDSEIASYNGETLPSTWISDRDVYAIGTTPTVGAQVVYKLATPIVYQLDSVTVNTLLGNNTIYVNCGSVSVDYPADTELFLTARDDEIIESIAPIENGTTASQAYAHGAYFFHNAKFCKALTAIASGATFTLDTNYTETTLAAELFAAQN